ncbi:MAG: flagellar hook protein FlgE [Burkholderiaceae bacterium]|nr:flagellar hook protein FlgE [Burkholderiaceae bacterium]
MSFQQGLSGLAGAAKSLDVIGNNIANSGTVGFKQSQVQFSDIYARSLNGVGGAVAGIGVTVAAIAQQFSQGNIETSSNPLDIAINGAGFFRTEVNGAIQYSRNGQFQLDKNGFMVNAQLAKLTGYNADTNGKILAGAPEPIMINPGDMMPQETTSVKTQVNLNSHSQQPETTPFDADDTTSYNRQIPTQVFDTLGNPHTMSSFYVKTGTNTWDVYVAADGMELASANVAALVQTDPSTIAARAAFQTAVNLQPPDPAGVITAAQAYAAAAGAVMEAGAVAASATAAQIQNINDAYFPAGRQAELGSMTPDQIDATIGAAVKVPAIAQGTLLFTTTGALDKTNMLLQQDPTQAAGILQTLPFSFDLPLFPDTGAVKPLTIEFDLTGSTQIFDDTAEKKTVQDGYSGGALTTFAAGADGIIIGQYSNGRTRPLAQIVLADFANPNGLDPLGNNAWRETSASGVPLVGEPNTGKFGLLRSSAVEVSNVDLTAELVNMITAQRAYQANAQTIKTQDSVMQTLVNLR